MRANKNKSVWVLRGDLDSQTSKFRIQNPLQPLKHQVHPWHLERRIKDWTFERERDWVEEQEEALMEGLEM